MNNYNDNRSRRGRDGGRFGGRGFSGQRFGGDRDSQRPTMHTAICDECGNSCEVPFKPTGDKPVFCNNCFENKRGNDSRGGRNERRFERSDFAEKQMFSAVCDECGNSCEVPFKPTSGKPIFCSNCFEKRDPSRNDRGRAEGSNNNNQELKEQIDNLNEKLDKILQVLMAKATEVTTPKIKSPALKIISPKKIVKPKIKKITKKIVAKKTVTKKK